MCDSNERFDAYELGRVAGENLYRQNNRMAAELPNALQALFSNNEFREAMVVAGVTAEQSTSNDYMEETRSHPTFSVPTRTESRPKRRKGVVNKQHSIIPLPKIPDLDMETTQVTDSPTSSVMDFHNQRSHLPNPTIFGRLGEFSESQYEFILSNRPDVPYGVKMDAVDRRLGDGVYQPCIEENDIEKEIMMTDYSDYLFEEYSRSDNDNEFKEPVQEPRALELNEVEFEEEPQSQNNEEGDGREKSCLACRQNYKFQELHEGPSLANTKLIARELLWTSLGINKTFYGKEVDASQFCEVCTGRMMRMMKICEQIENLEDEFNGLRKEMCENLIPPYVHLVPIIQELNLDYLKSVMLEKMKTSFDKVKPGKLLLGQTIPVTPVEAAEQPNFSDPVNSAPAEVLELEDECESSVHLQKIISLELKPDAENDYCSEDKTLNSSRLIDQYDYDEEELKSKLKIKNSKHGDPKDFQCPKCSHTYKYQGFLKIHLQHHTNLESAAYECKVCNLRCSTEYKLKLHHNKHTGIKPFKCNHCDKRFGTKQARANHDRIHKNESSLICGICDKRCRSKTSLNYHVRTHTGESVKSYQCKHCDAKFTHISNLKAHQRQHTGLKPLRCTICDRSFGRMRVVIAHFLRYHPEVGIESNIERTYLNETSKELQS